MIVLSYSVIKPKLTLVLVNGNGKDIDKSAVKSELDKVYLPVAVDWQVSVDEDFNITVDSLKITQSGLFSQYTDEMKSLNSSFVQHKGAGYDPSTIYLFVLQFSQDDAATGDMPRSKQFGYIFTRTAGVDAAIYRTIAHEIAHGAFSLSHTFDSQYDIDKGTTNNLLDYTAGTDIVKHQWDAIHDPGLVIGMFERDEDAMMSLPCLGWFDDCKNVLQMLDEIREARIKDTNFSLKGYPESKGESTLTAKQVKIDGIDYKKIRLIYKPDQEKKSFHPGSYFQYNQQFLSEKGKIEEQHGFAFMINNSEIFKIIVDDDTSKISKLKIYLFGRGGTYESINRLFAVNETLSPAQVKEAREQIASLTDVEKKKELYLMLQKKVPYHSQRDNGSPATDEDIANNSWMTTYNISTAGDIMCNLTSEAMCLEYLGITPPCKGCSSNCNSYDQFEDYMECTRVDKGFDHRGKANTREELAELFYNVGYESVILKTYEKDVIENKLRTSLEDGCSVLISAFGMSVYKA